MMMISYDDVGDYDGFHDDDGGEWRRWGTLGEQRKGTGGTGCSTNLDTYLF